MQNFKSYLKENQVKPWQVTTEEELLKIPGWSRFDHVLGHVDSNTGEIRCFGNFKNGLYIINEQDYGSGLNIEDEFLREYEGEYYLPFQIAPTNLIVQVSDCKIFSFIGLPSKVNDLYISNCPNIKSFEGIPSIINGCLSFRTTNVVYELSKYVKEMKMFAIHNDTEYKGYLSFVKIKGFKAFRLGWFLDDKKEKTIKRITGIITKHLKTNDIIGCSEELIENGFKEYAKL